MAQENQANQPAGGTPDAGAGTTPAEAPGVDLKTILDYDPFEAKPGIENSQEPAAGTEVVTPPTQPGTPPPQEQTPQAPTLEQFQELQARIAAMEAARHQQQQAPQGQQQTQPQGQPGQQGQQGQTGTQPQRRYGFQVQQQIFDGLNAEDPNVRNGSLVTLMNGMSEVIHDTVLKEVQGMLEQMAQHVPQQIQQTTQAQAEQKKVFDDFYGTYPELNNPTLHTLVGQIAGQIGAKKPGGWTPALRDEIGREVYRILKWPIPGQRQNVPKPPAQSSSTARPGAPAPMNDQVADMIDLLTP